MVLAAIDKISEWISYCVSGTIHLILILAGMPLERQDGSSFDWSLLQTVYCFMTAPPVLNFLIAAIFSYLLFWVSSLTQIQCGADRNDLIAQERIDIMDAAAVIPQIENLHPSEIPGPSEILEAALHRTQSSNPNDERDAAITGDESTLRSASNNVALREAAQKISDYEQEVLNLKTLLREKSGMLQMKEIELSRSAELEQQLIAEVSALRKVERVHLINISELVEAQKAQSAAVAALTERLKDVSQVTNDFERKFLVLQAANAALTNQVYQSNNFLNSLQAKERSSVESLQEKSNTIRQLEGKVSQLVCELEREKAGRDAAIAEAELARQVVADPTAAPDEDMLDSLELSIFSGLSDDVEMCCNRGECTYMPELNEAKASIAQQKIVISQLRSELATAKGMICTCGRMTNNCQARLPQMENEDEFLAINYDHIRKEGQLQVDLVYRQMEGFGRELDEWVASRENSFKATISTCSKCRKTVSDKSIANAHAEIIQIQGTARVMFKRVAQVQQRFKELQNAVETMVSKIDLETDMINA